MNFSMFIGFVGICSFGMFTAPGISHSNHSHIDCQASRVVRYGAVRLYFYFICHRIDIEEQSDFSELQHTHLVLLYQSTDRSY